MVGIKDLIGSTSLRGETVNGESLTLKENETFTLSVGVAEMAEEDYADLLIARTQAALDRASNQGGNQTSR